MTIVFTDKHVQTFVFTYKASLRALRFRSAVKLASSILSGDQGVKIRASKMAARNITKAMEDTEAKNGNDNFLTAMPEASPKAEPKRSSFTASAGIDDIFFGKLGSDFVYVFF